MGSKKVTLKRKDTHRPDSTMRMRMLLVSGVMLIVALVIISNLITISIKNNARYEALANENQFKGKKVEANRGSIYDSDGKILAQSATVYTIVVAPKLLNDLDNEKVDTATGLTEQKRQKQTVARILADNLKDQGVTYDGVIADIEDTIKDNPNSQWLKIASEIEKPKADAILAAANEAALAFGVIYTEQGTKRYYPQGDLAASIVGFTNFDGDGVYGVEAYYNEYLAGVDGKIITATDANGNEMPYKNEENYSAQDGSSVYLTINEKLQYSLEKNLAQAVEDYGVENRACGIIMNAKTGAVLAMATAPGYDLNDRNAIYYEDDRKELEEIQELIDKEKKRDDDDEHESEPDPTMMGEYELKAYEQGITLQELYDQTYSSMREQQWKNKTITELYYPGSVFKVITGSAALEEKAISINTSFGCNYTYTVVDTDFHCWSARAHGMLDFTRAMTTSCNPYFIQTGQALGGTNFCNYFKAFGFTEKTGIDLPGEVDSIYVSAENMGPVELASCAFGQSNKITPLQMITAYAAVVNGGYLLQPYVVSKVVDANGNIVKTAETTVKRQVISEETSAQMRSVLETVVNANGGSNAYIKGYKIGGKSGTAQKQDKNIQEKREDLYASSYCGFFPADDPEIIMLVVIDEPLGYDANGSHIYYGSVTACPVVRNTFKEILPALNYYPEYTDEELAAMDITVPSVEGHTCERAQETLEELGLTVEVIGEGDSVVAQMPARGSGVPREGRVILYTEEDYETEYTTVPNVLGYSVSDVNLLLSQAGLNFKVGDGAANHSGAVSSAQNYYYGDLVPRGTVVEVYFTIKDEG
ncbi:MAG: PASTA domain-containing protein [Oscillospiraceae bacterium]|nr:PASTA domain-containing protein [Oscillospiraceae bacterium]